MRKFLAILLTMCMLSTLVVMPVSAANVTITLNANTGVLGANTEFDGDYAVFDGVGDSVTFTIDVAESGNYKALVRVASNLSGGLTAHHYAPALFVDGVVVSHGLYTKDYYPNPETNVIHNPVYLEAGTHTIKVENFVGNYKLKNVEFYTDGSAVTVPTRFETLAGHHSTNPVNPGAVYAGDKFAAQMHHGSAAYKVKAVLGAPETAFYKVSARVRVTGASIGNENVVVANASIAGNEFTNIPVGANLTNDSFKEITIIENLPLSKGSHMLEMYGGNAQYVVSYWDHIYLEKTGDVDALAVESYKANGTAFASGADDVKRGADSFEIDVNIDLETSTVTDSTVSIKNGDVTVAAEVSATGDKIKIALKETLEFGTTYTLNISGVKDVLNRDLTQSISFTTVADSGTDAGAGTVTVASETLVGNTVTVSGTVKSSADKLIKGRTVKVTVTPPIVANAYETTETDVTDENGAFELSFSLSTEGESGNFTFTVHDEYASATPFEHIFVTDTTKLAIINGLKESTDASAVEDVFEVQAYVWGASYPADLSVLEDADDTLFLNHFVGYEAADVEDVKAQYALWLKFETLNQTNTAGTVSTILASSEDCAAFGLDKAAIDLIVTNKSAFEAAVAALTKQDSLEAYQAKFAEVLNEYLATEFGKTDVALQTSNVSGHPGQGATFSYKFASALTDVAELKIDVVSTSSSVAISESNIAVALEGATYDVTSIPSGVSVLIEAADALELDNETTVITVSVTSPAVGSYSIKTSGVVTYVSGTTNYTTDIPETTATLTVTAAPSYSGGGGGVSSTTKPVEDTKSEGMDLESGTEEPGTDEPGTDEPGTDAPSTGDFKFNDIESVDWAAESINSLLDKGIISKSEDGKFNPNNEVTREEFVKMMVVAMGVYDEHAASNLKDVDKNEWYAAYVASAEKAGLISGNDDGTFGVGDEISREDMSVIIYRAMAKLGLIEAASGGDFADDSEISDYAKEAVYALKSLGILNGVGNNKFAPQGTATRAMAAKVIYEMLEGISK